MGNLNRVTIMSRFIGKFLYSREFLAITAAAMFSFAYASTANAGEGGSIGGGTGVTPGSIGQFPPPDDTPHLPPSGNEGGSPVDPNSIMPVTDIVIIPPGDGGPNQKDLTPSGIPPVASLTPDNIFPSDDIDITPPGDGGPNLKDIPISSATPIGSVTPCAVIPISASGIPGTAIAIGSGCGGGGGGGSGGDDDLTEVNQSGVKDPVPGGGGNEDLFGGGNEGFSPEQLGALSPAAGGAFGEDDEMIVCMNAYLQNGWDTAEWQARCAGEGDDSTS